RLDRLEDALARLRVDAHDRLVEEQDRGPVKHAAGEVQAPAHAAREPRDRLLGARGEADQVERGGRAPRGLPPPEPERAREEAQVLARPECGVDRHLLRDEAERAARAGGAGRERVARHRDPPRVEAQQRGEDAERRRLAGAVGTQVPEQEVRILDLVLRPRGVRRRVLEEVAAFRPDLVGYSAMSFQYETARLLAASVRAAAPGALHVLGWYHATVLADQVAARDGQVFDFIVRGEGERAF